MTFDPLRLGLFYDESAYQGPAPGPPRGPGRAGGPPGLTGRPVAGRGFLDALLGHGAGGALTAFVTRPGDGPAFVDQVRARPADPGREWRVDVVEERHFHARVFPDPPATVIHFPDPPAARYAWARRHGGPGSFALSGAARTLATPAAAEALRDLVTAPFESFDALICHSRAGADVVRALTGAYAEHLRDRHGGDPALRVRLEVIPPGVDLEAFRPPTALERASSRRALGIADDAVAVLYVGRLSLHSKAHPFPLFDGVARAARATGRAVHLVLAGWAALDAIEKAFLEGARVFAPGVPVTIVDGTRPPHRAGAWHAADLFATFPDNLQETFNLTVLEAMASGLPVVAADWGGTRDQVVPGETGLLVPTALVRGALIDAAARLLVQEVNYDHFLAECNQATVVDLAASAAALRRLIIDDELRRRMGAAGRARARAHFTWPASIRAHERLWQGQEAERRAWRARAGERRRPDMGPVPGPAGHPTPEHTHAGYPTTMLGDDDRLVADEHARERLSWLLGLPLTHYMAQLRSADPDVLRAVLADAATPRTLAALDAVLAGAGVPRTPGRATLAWMLKYGLLRREGGW